MLKKNVIKVNGSTITKMSNKQQSDAVRKSKRRETKNRRRDVKQLVQRPSLNDEKIHTFMRYGGKMEYCL